jgi:CheY-like chemotaxis protein
VKRILVLEPDREVRTLYQRAIQRLGHSSVVPGDDGVVDLAGVDAVIVEPGSPHELAIVHTAHERKPALPVVCASIYPANSFGLNPVAFLEKPFRLAALERALELAFADGEQTELVARIAVSS